MSYAFPDREQQKPYEQGFPLPEAPAANQLPPGDGAQIVPHFQTFAQIVNYASRVYRWTHDEALRDSWTNALAIRRDPVIMDALRSRQLPTAQLAWHLECEDDQDSRQAEAVEKLTKCVERIPRFQQLKMHLLEALWFGRYGVQMSYQWYFDQGQKFLRVRDFKPINGDKLVFRFSGQPGILVHQQYQGDYEQTDRGRAHFFNQYERDQLLIHRHEPEDADFFEPELGGSLQGVGIRGRIYWLWFLRSQVTAFLMDYLERCGAGGFTIYFYEAGSQTSANEVTSAIENQWRNNAILFPRYRDGTKGGPGIERIEPSTAGAQLMQALVTQYFDDVMRRYILGQNLTTEAASTGLGSGLADLHGETFARYVKYDAQNLQDTLTEQLVCVLQKNSPYRDLPPIRFVFDVDKPNANETLGAAQAFFEMGGTIDEDQLRSIIGLEKPAPGSAMLAKMGAMSPAAAGSVPTGVPMMGQPGPEMGQPGAMPPEGTPPDVAGQGGPVIMRKRGKRFRFAANSNETSIGDILINGLSLYKALNNVDRGKLSRTKGPVSLWQLEDGRHLLIDGHHRLVQALLEGRKSVPTAVVGRGYTDYWATPDKESEFKFLPDSPHLGLEDMYDNELLEDTKERYRQRQSTVKMRKRGPRLKFSEQDFHNAVTKHFPQARRLEDIAPDPDNEQAVNEYVVESPEHYVYLNYAPRRNTAQLDFRFKNYRPDTANVWSPGKSVGKGSASFARNLKQFLGVLSQNGLGLEYGADKKHRTAYRRLLKQLGWRLKKTYGGDVGDLQYDYWLPPAREAGPASSPRQEQVKEPTPPVEEDHGLELVPAPRKRVKFSAKKTLTAHPGVLEHANSYLRKVGLPEHPAESPYLPVDEQRAHRIADLYEQLKHNPDDPRVLKAYDAFKKEILAQYHHLAKQGVKFEPYEGEGQPYANSAEMAEDARKGHLSFFTGGDFPKSHHLAQPSGVKHGGRDLTYNDLFRAVHDYYGHALYGNQFGPRGEEHAYRTHARMFSPTARPAMAAETRGQNSWVNYGRHIRESSNPPAPANRPYAEQKNAVLPEDLLGD